MPRERKQISESQPLASLRTDLVVIPRSKVGQRAFRIVDQRGAQSFDFEFYELEYAVATSLDGMRSATDIVKVLGDTGFTVTVKQVLSFYRELAGMGFVNSGTGPAPAAAAAAEADHSGDAIGFLRQGSAYLAENKIDFARQYFQAALEIDPANRPAKDGLHECDRLESQRNSSARWTPPNPIALGSIQGLASPALDLDEGDAETTVEPYSSDTAETQFRPATTGDGGAIQFRPATDPSTVVVFDQAQQVPQTPAPWMLPPARPSMPSMPIDARRRKRLVIGGSIAAAGVLVLVIALASGGKTAAGEPPVEPPVAMVATPPPDATIAEPALRPTPARPRDAGPDAPPVSETPDAAVAPTPVATQSIEARIARVEPGLVRLTAPIAGTVVEAPARGSGVHRGNVVFSISQTTGGPDRRSKTYQDAVAKVAELEALAKADADTYKAFLERAKKNLARLGEPSVITRPIRAAQSGRIDQAVKRSSTVRVGDLLGVIRDDHAALVTLATDSALAVVTSAWSCELVGTKTSCTVTTAKDGVVTLGIAAIVKPIVAGAKVQLSPPRP